MALDTIGVSVFKLIVNSVSADVAGLPRPINTLPKIWCTLDPYVPTLILPPTAKPPKPATTNAPVVLLVLVVPLAATKLPECLVIPAMVVVPLALPIAIVVAAPNALTVVALVLNNVNVPVLVVANVGLAPL